MRERESLFNEYLLDVRKREKEEKVMRREQVRLLRTDCLPHTGRWILANDLTAEYCRIFLTFPHFILSS